MPTTNRANKEAPRLSRDVCIITSMVFNGQRPTECYKIFKASALYIVIKLTTATEYRNQHERATSAAELSSPLQAILQVLDAVQPATMWTRDERLSTRCGLQPHLPPVYVLCPLPHPPGQPIHDYQVPHPPSPPSLRPQGRRLLGAVVAHIHSGTIVDLEVQ